MDGSASCWFLNFDADMELERPRDYTPKKALLERFKLYIPRLSGLIGDDAIVIGNGMRARGAGRAWCMTPRARAMLLRAGAEPVSAPDLSVLQAVNDRAFSAALGQTLPYARFAKNLEDVIETLSRAPAGQVFLAKRAFGFSGRGQRRITLESVQNNPADKAFLAASFKRGLGLSIEPLVKRIQDFGLHGYVSPTGEVMMGEPTLQICNGFGAWEASVRAQPGDLPASERELLFLEAQRTAQALYSAGYFGAFGIDAFSWEDEAQHRHFNARCEINARYSMGWAIGMGKLRPDLDKR